MTEISHDRRPTLVLGGTGKTGRRVVERLEARGLPVRVGSRSGEPPVRLGGPVDLGTGAARGGGGIRPYYPDLIVPEAPEAARALAELAVDQGVEPVGAADGPGRGRGPAAEREVQATGAEVTIVRCAWFMQNFSEDFLLESSVRGVVGAPGHRRQLEPFVDADDVADVAVAALTEPGHAGQVYELTGPAAAELRRGRRRDRQGQRARRSTTCRCRWRTTRPAPPTQGLPAELVGS